MPRRNTVYDDVGRGFAAFLAPPPPDVIRFTVGQPDFETPAKAVEAAVAGLRSGAHGYTRSQGSESLCEAVANHLRGYGIGAAPADIVVTPGCKQAVLYALMTTLAPGDEVVLLSPAWPSYDGMVRMAVCRCTSRFAVTTTTQTLTPSVLRSPREPRPSF